MILGDRTQNKLSNTLLHLNRCQVTNKIPWIFLELKKQVIRCTSITEQHRIPPHAIMVCPTHLSTKQGRPKNIILHHSLTREQICEIKLKVKNLNTQK
jgi:hypothetical protein